MFIPYFNIWSLVFFHWINKSLNANFSFKWKKCTHTHTISMSHFLVCIFVLLVKPEVLFLKYQLILETVREFPIKTDQNNATFLWCSSKLLFHNWTYVFSSSCWWIRPLFYYGLFTIINVCSFTSIRNPTRFLKLFLAIEE